MIKSFFLGWLSPLLLAYLFPSSLERIGIQSFRKIQVEERLIIASLEAKNLSVRLSKSIFVFHKTGDEHCAVSPSFCKTVIKPERDGSRDIIMNPEINRTFLIDHFNSFVDFSFLDPIGLQHNVGNFSRGGAIIVKLDLDCMKLVTPRVFKDASSFNTNVCPQLFLRIFPRNFVGLPHSFSSFASVFNSFASEQYLPKQKESAYRRYDYSDSTKGHHPERPNRHGLLRSQVAALAFAAIFGFGIACYELSQVGKSRSVGLNLVWVILFSTGCFSTGFGALFFAMAIA